MTAHTKNRAKMAMKIANVSSAISIMVALLLVGVR